MNRPNVGAIDGHTQWVALLGYPVKHSFSPAMHNAAFERLGLNWRYAALGVKPEDLGAGIAGLAALGFRGANVTVPHKEQAIRWLDAVDPSAQRLGAVNTIVISEDGKTKGYNTDGTGFLRGLQQDNFSVAGASVMLLGAGGAARAVAFALLDGGVRSLTVVNRRRDKAEALLQSLRQWGADGVTLRSGEWEPDFLRDSAKKADLIVNATSSGMVKEESHIAYPIPPQQWLAPGPFVCDLVYNPPETELLAVARSLGCRCQNGLPMLLHQGAAAFRLWTGLEAPTPVMADALLAVRGN
ncbi:shikimate dehydrogenase [Heliobacterium gestii]|uniref:Shikimate dehydrogenase (NADP(+)) n=1 Tax=Heliomicrobium gestii TaxID=2699 RepID=A0A845LIN9_HELGE|nr:shikimate dehydrogenase [Heliomicrobium gestii]MBM7867885.1 shikimate dehydrogenase [Heliomicrobium gestii]MZP43303.1 shikimate dehydrogenase [Heliomicrobium gestii]